MKKEIEIYHPIDGINKFLEFKKEYYKVGNSFLNANDIVSLFNINNSEIYTDNNIRYCTFGDIIKIDNEYKMINILSLYPIKKRQFKIVENFIPTFKDESKIYQLYSDFVDDFENEFSIQNNNGLPSFFIKNEILNNKVKDIDKDLEFYILAGNTLLINKKYFIDIYHKILTNIINNKQFNTLY